MGPGEVYRSIASRLMTLVLYLRSINNDAKIPGPLIHVAEIENVGI